MRARLLADKFDAFTSFDDDGLRLLVTALNQPLTAARTEVYYPDEGSTFVDGPLELTFGPRHVVQTTDAHSGLCILPYKLYGDPAHPDIPSQLRPLTEAAIAIGEVCCDIEIILEKTAGLHGCDYLTAGLLFRFLSATIGIENFEHLQGTSRSSIVVNPDWTSHRRLSLASGLPLT